MDRAYQHRTADVATFTGMGGWRAAMERALYAEGTGFFVGATPPSAHFRTSVHASPLFARALARLLVQVDEALGRPSTVDVVDVGAGRGELLLALLDAVPPDLAARLRLTAVERAPRPASLPPSVAWTSSPPPVTGMLVATEWLDNVPLDLATLADVPRYVEVDGTPGEPLSTVDKEWLERWWPLGSGDVAEIGLPRDVAWRDALSTVDRGLAVCVDYGHVRDCRPRSGTLTGYRYGRQVAPVPDGSCDLTAHVAIDALATPRSTVLRQRDALRTLGVRGERPARPLATTDPTAYVRALAEASQAAELTEPAGLGGHYWLLEPVGIPSPL
jgi:SAM-dependent MidA family methyltransferase